MNRFRGAAIGGAMMIGLAGSAQAAVFNFSFSAPIIHDSDRTVVGQGTIDAEDKGNGVFSVTGASGTSDDQGYANEIVGGSGTITAVAGGFTADGLQLTTSQGPGFYWFTLNDDGKSYGVMMGEIGSNNATLSLGAVTNAVPEPASWAMMVAGFAVVAGLMRPRRRGARVVSA